MSQYSQTTTKRPPIPIQVIQPLIPPLQNRLIHPPRPLHLLQAMHDVKDWMKDQAVGEDYSYDDGGEYYCMGKNDTCPNKTKNAYDLYCNSCDPDGDNIEG